MRISSINLKQTTIHSNQNKIATIPNFKNSFDTVSFNAKSKQTNLTAEGKSIAKNAHGIYAQSQKIQEGTKDFLNKSAKIQQQADEYLKEAQQEWQEISNLLNYARKNKTRAIVDPFAQTELFFDINENKDIVTLHEYKNGKLARKIINRPNITTVTTYGNSIERKMFDSQTGAIYKYDQNVLTGSTTKIEHSYSFDNGSLKKYSHNKVQNAENTKTQEVFDFENGKLTKITFSSYSTKTGFSSGDEEYLFKDNKLTRFIKSPQQENENYEASEEEYIYDDKKFTYVKNKNDIFGVIKTADIIYHIDNAKIKKAIISLSEGQNIKTIDKLFTFDKHEKPQYCYLVYQAETNTDDENFSYDNMVWLGGKKS